MRRPLMAMTMTMTMIRMTMSCWLSLMTVIFRSLAVPYNVRSSFKAAYTSRKTIFASMPISLAGSPMCVKHPHSNVHYFC